MAILIKDIDRVLTANGKVVMDGMGRVAICRNTGALVLELEVIGTHFPSMSTPTDSLDCYFNLFNIDNKDGNVEIDYADGTGFHSYPFKVNGSERGMSISRKPNNQIAGPPTPANISVTGVFNYPVYFYEDLPLPYGTVDDFYDHHRIIKIRFEKFADLKEFITYSVGFYGVLPESISRFRNIDVINISRGIHLTGFAGDFNKVFCRALIFRDLGFNSGNQIPEFILNSPTLEIIGLSGLVTLNTNAVDSKLDLFFSNLLPSLNGFLLESCGISFQMPNLHREMTGTTFLDNNTSSSFRLSPDLTNWAFGELRVTNTRMPLSEYVRLLETSKVVELRLLNVGLNSDFDLSTTNNYLQTLRINNKYGGFLPTFISKLSVLTFLEVRINSLITSWGTAGASSTLQTLVVDRSSVLDPIIPAWFTSLTSLTQFDSWSWQTQTRIDNHVTSFYGVVDANSPMTGTGLFRGLNYRLVDNILATNTNLRPSGTYQAPAGYVQGSANGTPATPMEMIYVLVNQYAMIVSVLNVAGTGIDIYTP